MHIQDGFPLGVTGLILQISLAITHGIRSHLISQVFKALGDITTICLHHSSHDHAQVPSSVAALKL